MQVELGEIIQESKAHFCMFFKFHPVLFETIPKRKLNSVLEPTIFILIN